MNNLVGIILLIYGALGVAATAYAYLQLRSPVRELREFLATIARNLGKAGKAAVEAAPEIESTGKKGLDLLQDSLSSISSELGDGLESLRSVRSVVDGTATIVGKVEVPDGIDIKFDSVKIPAVGKVQFPKSVDLEFARPLGPVEKKLDAMVEQLDGIITITSSVKKSITRVNAELPERGVAFVESVSTVVKTSGSEMLEAEQSVQALSASNLLALAPMAALGYIGFLHLAFLLTGLGFLVD